MRSASGVWCCTVRTLAYRTNLIVRPVIDTYSDHAQFAAADLGTDPEVVDRLYREYEKHLRVLHANGASIDDEPVLRHDQHYTALRLALLAHKRATVVRLHDARRIDDIVLRQVQRRLDIEEVRLSRREVVD